MSARVYHRRVPTANGMGWSTTVLNEVSSLFIDECRLRQGTVLDIGAGLGVASLAALETGARVIANDADMGQLESIAERSGAARERLQLQKGRFPYKLKLEEESLDAAHASHVFHFLTGRQLEIGAESLHWWLKPGGRVFAVAATPYFGPFASFAAEYETRVGRAEAWPGWVENTRAITEHRLMSQVPKSIHLLDDKTLTRVFAGAGFEVERCWMFRRHDLPASVHHDGRESVGLVARKI